MSKLYVLLGEKVPEFFYDSMALDILKSKDALMDRLKSLNPEIGYPYFVLFTHPKRNRLFIARPDSRYGGIEGPLSALSEEYDVKRPKNLARLLSEELNKPITDSVHLNPITAALDFTNSQFRETWSLLGTQYHHSIAYLRLK